MAEYYGRRQHGGKPRPHQPALNIESARDARNIRQLNFCLGDTPPSAGPAAAARCARLAIRNAPHSTTVMAQAGTPDHVGWIDTDDGHTLLLPGRRPSGENRQLCYDVGTQSGSLCASRQPGESGTRRSPLCSSGTGFGTAITARILWGKLATSFSPVIASDGWPSGRRRQS